MGILFSNGTLTTSTSEKTIFNITADEHIAGWIFAHNMQMGDQVMIKTYEYDLNGLILREYDSSVLTDVQDKPAKYITFLPSKEMKLTIQRLAGTDRAFTWLRAEVS